jgi:hypothetical protein
VQICAESSEYPRNGNVLLDTDAEVAKAIEGEGVDSTAKAMAI